MLSHQRDSIILTNPYTDVTSVKTMCASVKSATSLSRTHGMRYYGDVYSFSLHRLSYYVDNEIWHMVSDHGNWMIFGDRKMLKDAIICLGNYIDKTHNPDLISAKFTRLDLQDDGILLMKCRPIFKVDQVKRCLDTFQMVLRGIFEDHKLSKISWFFKPDIITFEGISMSSNMKSYVFKSRMHLN